MPPVVAAAVLFVETIGAAALVAVGASGFATGVAIAAGTLIVAAGVYATNAAITAMMQTLACRNPTRIKLGSKQCAALSNRKKLFTVRL